MKKKKKKKKKENAETETQQTQSKHTLCIHHFYKHVNVTYMRVTLQTIIFISKGRQTSSNALRPVSFNEPKMLQKWVKDHLHFSFEMKRVNFIV